MGIIHNYLISIQHTPIVTIFACILYYKHSSSINHLTLSSSINHLTRGKGDSMSQDNIIGCLPLLL